LAIVIPILAIVQVFIGHLVLTELSRGSSKLRDPNTFIYILHALFWPILWFRYQRRKRRYRKSAQMTSDL